MKRHIIISILVAIVCLAIPSLSLAARVYMTTSDSEISVGDTILINVLFDPQGKTPNVVEGSVVIKSGSENIKISEVSTADSVLKYWAKNPTVDTNSKISFMGGTPGGFDKSGLLFKIIVQANKEGKVVFAPTDIKAYENDGKASPLDMFSSELTIDVGPKNAEQTQDQWQAIVSEDKQPPKNLSAVVGQADSAFEGKTFLTISATDDESGIDHYEVIEGNRPIVRTEETYVLQDQSKSSEITVFAYDKAGNYSKISVRADGSTENYKKIVIGLFVFLLAFYALTKLYKIVFKKNV